MAELDADLDAVQSALSEVAFRRRWAFLGVLGVAAAIIAFISLVVFNLAFLVLIYVMAFVSAGGFYCVTALLGLRDRAISLTRQAEEIKQDRRSLLAGRWKRAAAPYARYKEHLPNTIEMYRLRAVRYRRLNTVVQLIVIVGSVSASTVTGALSGVPAWRVTAAIMMLLVGVAASCANVFRLRERNDNLQRTADQIEQQYRAAELRLGDYAHIPDQAALLRTLVERVEQLRYEQADKERQLDQPPDLQRSIMP